MGNAMNEEIDETRFCEKRNSFRNEHGRQTCSNPWWRI